MSVNSLSGRQVREGKESDRGVLSNKRVTSGDTGTRSRWGQLGDSVDHASRVVPVEAVGSWSTYPATPTRRWVEAAFAALNCPALPTGSVQLAVVPLRSLPVSAERATKNDPAPDVNSVTVENPCFRQLNGYHGKHKMHITWSWRMQGASGSAGERQQS